MRSDFFLSFYSNLILIPLVFFPTDDERFDRSIKPNILSFKEISQLDVFIIEALIVKRLLL